MIAAKEFQRQEFNEKVLKLLGRNVGRPVEVKLDGDVIYAKLDGFGYDGINPLTLVLQTENNGRMIINYAKIVWVRFSKNSYR
jgi:hypothetical protein